MMIVSRIGSVLSIEIRLLVARVEHAVPGRHLVAERPK